MSKNLVIVESPAKAKTIEGFLGEGFIVKSSFGHIRDLPGKNISIDIENNFEPQYVISDDKKKVVAELKKLAKASDVVWLATDEDREGEAISWHLEEALGLKNKETKRIVFSEITKAAITAAIKNPRTVNKDLVDAQQARRVLDRLVGYELSPVLWKKVKPSLSAGRVQSVTVRLVVEREREITNFKVTDFFRVVGLFQLEKGRGFKAEVSSRFKDYESAKKFLQECEKSNFSVKDLVKKPATKSPAAPFTTSTLQQEASRKLGFSVAQTMLVAQKLYEAGKVTYMRTDSVNLSDTAVNGSAEYITKNYGKEYSNPKKYNTKSKGAQEAHEAIRPTNLGLDSLGGSTQEGRLYELIWKRTTASQMSNAKIERTTATINVSESTTDFTAKGEILQFEGFLKVYLEGNDDEEDDKEQEGMLPAMSKGEKVNMNEIVSTQRFTKHPARYQEASLVKKLEELGIGRPSTYAPTISTIQKRGYVVKEERDGMERKYEVLTLDTKGIIEATQTERTGAEKNKLFPTDTGIVVTDFLTENFKNIMDYSFTADVEKQFDDIADGQLKWNKMIETFYNPFHKTVEHTLEHAERAKGERLLGDDPATGKPVYARIGRYGAMVQIGHVDDEEKPKFASLLKNQSIETITYEEAMELFKLPREIGEYEDKLVTAAIGRFGPYLKWNSLFISLKKAEGDDPFTVEMDRAAVLIEAKKEQEANKYIKVFEEDKNIQVLNGRWGPYIKFGKKNVKIPKDLIPQDLTLEDCKRIAAEAPAKKRVVRKPKAKTTIKKGK
ncbi:MAG: type I DNA topoisomerase [Flavobacteriales bacterium]|nr:type I DNA topoisomerase [Flavobacteriales bacterium]